jgi:hypothetical protein
MIRRLGAEVDADCAFTAEADDQRRRKAGDLKFDAFNQSRRFGQQIFPIVLFLRHDPGDAKSDA